MNSLIKYIDKVEYNGILYTVVNKGSIMLVNNILYDQLDESLPIIPRKTLGYYIRKKYDLSQKEYYNIIVFGDGSIIPKCHICGVPVSFRGLTKGFYDETCSKSHAQALTARNGTHHFITKFGSMSASSKIITRKRFENGTHHFYDFRVRSSNHRSIFLSKGNLLDECVLYVTHVPDTNMIKIGVSANLNNRKFMNEISGFKFTDTEILVKSTRDKIADLEFNIKVDLHYLSVKDLEYFDKLDINKIKSYIEVYLSDLND